MTWRVMVSAPYMRPVIDRFRPFFSENGVTLVLPPVEERLEEQDLLPWVEDVDGVICGDDRFTERVLLAAPRLRVISKWGTGIDSIDAEAAARHGVAVRNTPDAFTDPVADSVMGYVLGFARRLADLDREMKAGKWTKLPGHALCERTLGIIGVGRIGKAIARRARPFGVHLVGADVAEMPAEFLEETGIEMVPKAELLARSDFVSLNCDLNSTSRHIIDEEDLAGMRDHAVLVNAARGPLVREEALVAALRDGRIAGAALDVFEVEPLPPGSPLRSMDNVMLAPHASNASPARWEWVHERTIENLMEELRRSEVGLHT